MAYSAGTAFLEVHPSFENIESLLARGARDIVKGLDKALGDQIGKATQKAAQQASRETDKAGQALGKTFTDGAIRRIQAALRNIPDTDRILAPMRKELEALSEIDLGRGFDEKDFIARVEKAYSALRRAQQDAQGKNMVSRYTNAGNAAQELGAVQDIVEQARKRGFAAGDAFSDAYLNRLKAMDRVLPDLKTTAKSTQEERAVAALKARIADAMRLQVGDMATRDNNPLNLKIGARIDGEDLKREMASIEALLDQFTERFTQTELVFPLDKARQQAGGFFADIQTQAEKASEEQAQAYLKAWDDAIKEQARRERAVRADMAKAYDQAVAEDYKRRKAVQDAFLRDWNAAEAEDWKRRKRARDQFQADWDAAIAESYKRQKRARDEFARAWDQAIAEDYKRQKRAQDEFLKDWEEALKEGRRRQQKAAEELQREADRQRAQSTAGTAQSMLGKARDRIIDLPVQLQVNAIDKQMAAIRKRIADLSQLEIGVNIDVESFADQVQAEFGRLRQIADDQTVDIDVRVDAAKAATELGGILVLLGRLKKEQAKVEVDTSGAVGGLREMAGALALNLGRLGALIAIGSSIGTAIVPAAAAAASTIGFIGTAALAAASGLGVMVLGFSGIGEAVSAMGQLADNQQKSTNNLNKANRQVESALGQIEQAERSLAETRRNSAQQAIRAARAISDALQDQKDTITDVRRANEEATRRVGDAQRNIIRAAEDERAARIRLNEAYKQAQRVLEDLRSAIRGNALDQRQAVLDLAEAKAELDSLLANPRATEAEREQARITYERRLLQMDDLKRTATELDEEQTERWRKGIDQVDEVVAARQALEDADERLKDSQIALKDAEREQTETRLDGIRKINDAQQKVDDARLAAAEQQRDAAYAEWQAQQSLIAARRTLASATDRDLVAGGAQLDNLNTAMAKLSPTAQDFARYIFGLREAFYALRDAASPMLAGLQTAMEQLFGRTSDEAITKLQPLFDFVGAVSTAIGEIFQRFADMLESPTFVRFFDYIKQSAVPTLFDMFEMFENISTGLVNLFLAFTPLTGEVSGGFLELTERFREWSEGLETNTGFQRLMDYIREAGPAVWDLLSELAKTIGHIVVAAAPVGMVVVQAFTKLLDLINSIPQDVLTALVAGIAAAATAIGLFAAVTAVALLGVPGLIAAGIAAVVIGFSALVGSSDWLREQLGRLWESIKTAAPVAFQFLKDAIAALRPVFDGLREAAISFYENGILPVFDAVRTLITNVINGLRPTFDDLGGIFAKIGGLAIFLYTEAVLPAFQGVMAVAGELFAFLRPIFDVLGTIIGAFGSIVLWLLNNIFIPVIGGIVKLLIKILAPIIRFLWQNILRPILRSWGLAFEVVAAIIKVAIGAIMLILKGLGALFKWLYENAIRPAWHGIRDNVFIPMRDWFSKHIQPYWERGIEGLGKAWDLLKKIVGTPVKFVVETLLNDGLLKGYNWLADKFDIEPKNVKIPAPKGGWTSFRSGGAVYGPGTETSDSIPARLSKGEHVLTAKEVRAAGGHQAIYAWRKGLLHGHQHGFRAGGAVGRGIGDGFGEWLKKTAKSLGKKASDAFDSAVEFVKNPLKSMEDLAKGLFDQIPGKDTWIVQRLVTIPREILAALKEKVTGLFSGGGQDGQTNGAVGGNSNALGGSLGMIQILRRIFPGLSLNSGFRPGSITVTGNLSYHARNRAIDVPPRPDVFEWIRANYPNSRELIFSPKGNRQIHNGRPHVYSGAVRNTHFDHVHWAYERGGLLPDTRRMPGGVMQVFHGRRTPDKVLTDNQWQNMATLAAKARESMTGGNTYNFPYRNATLDIDELNRWSARQDALSRVNRLNY